jgi:putative ubiquitin-RnfH superfamily antitoxin RatB of RatAB toxin-antitoxin module
MLTFNTSIVTAGYQGDYIQTIRATQGKTLLYALRQSKIRILMNEIIILDLDSYFVGGFKYDGKAVFAVIETSERVETVRELKSE